VHWKNADAASANSFLSAGQSMRYPDRKSGLALQTMASMSLPISPVGRYLLQLSLQLSHELDQQNRYAQNVLYPPKILLEHVSARIHACRAKHGKVSQSTFLGVTHFDLTLTPSFDLEGHMSACRFIRNYVRST